MSRLNPVVTRPKFNCNLPSPQPGYYQARRTSTRPGPPQTPEIAEPLLVMRRVEVPLCATGAYETRRGALPVMDAGELQVQEPSVLLFLKRSRIADQRAAQKHVTSRYEGTWLDF